MTARGAGVSIVKDAVDRAPRRGSGRPPDVDGGDTKAEILRVARNLFASHGYGGTTTRMIAAGVGVTPAALHHYFGRKRNLAIRVWQETTDAEYARVQAAVDDQCTFYGKARALLAAAAYADRESSLFIWSIREEARRTPELDEIAKDVRVAVLVRAVVAHGVSTGVVAVNATAAARAALTAVAFGATMLAVELDDRHVEQLTGGCVSLLDGTLYGPPTEPVLVPLVERAAPPSHPASSEKRARLRPRKAGPEEQMRGNVDH